MDFFSGKSFVTQNENIFNHDKKTMNECMNENNIRIKEMLV